MRGFAHFISVLFNPLLMLTYLTAILLYVFHSFPIHSTSESTVIISTVFIFTFVLPVAILLFLKVSGQVKTLFLKGRKERLLPYLFTAGFYFFTAYLLTDNNIEQELLFNLLIYSGVVILLVAAINLSFKISAHALTISSLVGFILILTFQNNAWENLVTLMVLILIAGLVVFSRKVLDAHDYFELISGTLLGLFVGSVASYIIL